MEKIINLAQKGFKFFPCLKSKAPATQYGFYDSTNNIEKLKDTFENKDYLIGFPCGKMNFNIIVLDFDLNKNNDIRSFDEILEEIESIVGEIPKDGFRVQTLHGGFHLYFKIDEDINFTGGTRFFHKSLPVDIQANGRYVIFPDNKNYFVYDSDIEIDNFYNHIPTLPENIINFKKPIIDTSENSKENLPSSEIKEIRSALNFINADDRDTWIHVGLALKNTGSPSAFGLWCEYSQRSEKYNASEMNKRWKGLKPNGDKTIASLFHLAQKNGWTTTYEKNSAVEISSILPPLDETPEEIKEPNFNKFDKKPFPEHLLHPKGLVGDIMQYILECAIRPQPIFALAGALSLVGTLAGRKYETPTRLRTNIYCLCVGPSGCGKDEPRQTIKNILHTANCNKYAGAESLASDAAILSELKDNPSKIFMLDEIGRFLKTTSSATKATHLYNVVSTLLSIHSSSASNFKGKSYADMSRQIIIDQPNLCLYGTTVPDSLYDGLPMDAISNGLLSRILLFETFDTRPEKRKITNEAYVHKPPIEIIDQIKALDARPLNCDPEGNLDNINPKPTMVKFTEEALKIIQEFSFFIENKRKGMDINNDKKEAIYNRTEALAMQIALILSIGRNIDNPIMDEYDVNYGCELALHLAEHTHYIADNYIAQNDLEHEVKKLYFQIRMKGKMTLSEITRKTQHLPGYLRIDVLDTLEESGQVIKTETKTKDGKRQIIFYNKNLIEGG